MNVKMNLLSTYFIIMFQSAIKLRKCEWKSQVIKKLTQFTGLIKCTPARDQNLLIALANSRWYGELT